ncbi:MAG: BrnA antitoxin family protein [Candidatus Acidiferrales bacterium]
MSKLSEQQKRDIRAIAAKSDADIDFSDAAPVLDWSSAEIGKFYRPTKQPVTIRVDSDVLAWLKAGGRGYQTKANWLLRQAMLHFQKQEGTVGLRRRARSDAKATGRKRKM